MLLSKFLRGSVGKGALVQYRAGEPPPEPPGREGKPGQEYRPEHRGVFFLLGNNFNICYDATLQHKFVCVRVCRKMLTGRGVKNVGLQLRRSCLKCKLL